MTRKEIRDVARKRLGETTSAFWTDDELNLYINLGCKNIAWRTKSLRDTGYINVQSCDANTTGAVSTEWTISSMDPLAFAINEVYFKRENTTYRRIEPSSREELDIETEEWQSLVGYTNVIDAGANLLFTGSGLDDMTFSGTYSGDAATEITYKVVIDANGTPDTFEWFKDNVSQASGVAITGAVQPLDLGFTVEFAATTGHTISDQWTWGSPTITYNYDSETSEPLQYYWSREEDNFGIYPPPSDEHDGAPLKIYYSKDHVDMSSDNAVPTLPTNLHLAAIDYTVASGLEDRGWGERANDHWNKYMKKLQDYEVEKGNEREDEEIIMKPYRNI
jgi:hypothetical protein